MKGVNFVKSIQYRFKPRILLRATNITSKLIDVRNSKASPQKITMLFPLKSLMMVSILALCISSCVPYKSIVNYSQSELMDGDTSAITNYTPLTVQVDDILIIGVSSGKQNETSDFGAAEYLVNSDGTIDFPLEGSIEVEGKTIVEVKNDLKERLGKYFVATPVITVRLGNFRINVNGEVASPGNFSVSGEKLNMIEAITMAGDFTDYSRRDKILVIREIDNKRTFGYVDFNAVDVMESPFFYLKQNDVVYVSPTRRKTGTVRNSQDRLLPYVTATTSVLLFLTFIFNLR